MTEETAVPMDKLARVYRKIRGKMQEMTKAHDEALAQLQVQLDAVKHAARAQMLAQGVKSVNTADGTIVRQTGVLTAERLRSHVEELLS